MGHVWGFETFYWFSVSILGSGTSTSEDGKQAQQSGKRLVRASALYEVACKRHGGQSRPASSLSNPFSASQPVEAKGAIFLPIRRK